MANDTFVMSVRQAAELDHAFARNGWSAEDIKKLSAGNTLGKFRKILLGQSSIATIERTIDLDADPFVPEGLTVEEHRKGGSFTWDASKVMLFLSEPQKRGRSIRGNKLRSALGQENAFNANLLDYLLKNPNLIPEDWKSKYIFFWGTIYCHRSSDLYVRYLFWNGGWDWHCRWLGSDFDGDCPAALLAS